MIVREHIRVISTDGERTRIEIVQPDDPSKCKTCPNSSTCCSGTGGARRFDVVGLRDAKEDESHVVDMELANPAYAAFLLFMLPMGVAFAAGLAAFHVSQNGLMGLGAGVAGAAAVYALVHFLGPSGPARVTIVK